MRRKERKKEQLILNAAVKEFAECGYHDAKVALIAQRAGIATGSVYLYYKNKENLLFTIFEQLWKDYTLALRNTLKRKDIGKSQKIDAIIDHLFDMFIENSDLALVFVNEHHMFLQDKDSIISQYYKIFLDLTEEIYFDGQNNHHSTSYVDVKVLREFITGGLRSVLRQGAQQPQASTLDSIRNTVKSFIINGLSIK